MARINLLPWREQKRKDQTTRFFIGMGTGVAITLVIVVIIHMIITGSISHQEARNQILNNEITQLNFALKEINDLEETKQQLLARMDVIQSLQQRRPQIVHLFDELVRTVPEGIYLREIKQSTDSLTIKGVAESNGRVSAYMRNIDASEWMTKPRLQVIESVRKDGRGSKFTLVAEQTSPKTDDEKAEGL